jgi:exodeoxyribonuclease VIII
MLPAAAVSNENGIRAGVDASEYHQKELGVISKSALDQIHRSPAHYRAWLDAKELKETAALAFGRAFHCSVLEPAVFAGTYVVQPDFGDCRFKANKAARDFWLEENAGKYIISADDSLAIAGMTASLRAHPAASKILVEGDPEVTLRWTDPETGLPGKSRADYHVKAKRLVADLKSTEDASPEAFARSVYKFRYHVQDALYRLAFAQCGEPIHHFALVAVEKDPPFAVAVYTLDEEAVARGLQAARKDISTLQACLETDSWVAYSNGVETLSLPRWAA